MNYLNLQGSVFTMKIIPDASNPKRWYCQRVSLLINFRSPSDRAKLRSYYRDEGIQFQFRYY